MKIPFRFDSEIMNHLNSLLSNIQHPLFLILAIVVLIILVYLVLSKNNSKDKFEELHQKIKEEINFAVSPKFMDLSVDVNELIDLAVEVWRIEQRIVKSATSLPESQLKGLENSTQKLRRYIQKYDVEIVDYKNQKYNDGLNLDILSIEKDANISEPTIKETVEPTIIYKGQVVRKAKIILLKNN